MRTLILAALLLAAAPCVAQESQAESGSAQVTGRSAFSKATSSGPGRDGEFCIRVMYNEVPLQLYGEVFIEGNATRCDGVDNVDVDAIELRFRYRGEAVQTKRCSKNHLCFFTERFFRGQKVLECAAVTATSGRWSANAVTAPGCL